jgi:ATP-dependent DNA helicase RecG
VLGYALGDEAIKRAEIMESTNDGFKLAEADLEMRGPGEFLGTRQSGLPGFRLANLVRDGRLLQQAKEAAFKLVATDPKLSSPQHARIRAQLDKVAAAWVG